MDKKCAQLWQRLSAALKPQISADSFKRWFSTVELVEAKEKSITLTVPNNIYQLWIESNYMPALQNAIVATFGNPRSVKFCGPSPTGAQTSEDVPTANEVVPPPRVDPRPGEKSNHNQIDAVRHGVALPADLGVPVQHPRRRADHYALRDYPICYRSALIAGLRTRGISLDEFFAFRRAVQGANPGNGRSSS